MWTERGTITLPGAVLADVVTRSVESVAGARVRRPRRGLEVEVDDGRARVSVELAVGFGLALPELAREVQERVADSLRSLCGLEPESVDVAIEELEA